MTKGKFGLSLAAIAVISFGFVALRQPQCVLLVAGFALLAEKDEWLNRQVMQALLLTIAYYLVDLVISWIFGGLARFFGWVRLYGASGAMNTVDTIISDLVYIALIVLCILAVLRLIRNKDAAVPFISKMAGGDFAAAFAAKPKPPAAPPQNVAPVQNVPSAQTNSPVQQPTPPVQQYTPPVQQYTPPVQQYTPPVQQYTPQVQQYTPQVQAPAAPPPSEPEAPLDAPEQEAITEPQDVLATRLCRNCSAPLSADARFCTECGTKAE